ncbi:exodeoxyribonuclease VII large subunit [Brevundimonas lutea]|uniref:exodeoxyribonuclease VII large subunit n=1 Tax=Brevundimonas lutea TaxID=2293980 RepID=UPI000F040875|nr:exodeoxyribonuclease VII large subunit [Brevundimonas lutea]
MPPSDDYAFGGSAAAAPEPARRNDQPLSISELSFALKRTLEDRFGHVRLRGEVSKVNRHGSGHVYLTLKDDKACIDGVIWKGQVRGLAAQPEMGLEVIVTGKITSYPARSSYQIVIETMEVAGAGALLAQLERLKARLAGEGLFEPARKRPIPRFPAVVGVITSPTGAVIRDILHRLSERWPCRVVIWPVVVQGEPAAGQVAAAVRGFDALPATGGPIPRPDVVIVARGGGSVEDLWPFNDETLARTVAAASIPIISAVGHETDTTLIDFVSDRRAPTPTGAAEMATPVLAELAAGLAELDRRLIGAGGRLVEDRRTRLRSVARGLPPRAQDLLALPSQRLDHAASRLGAALNANVAAHERRFAGAGPRLNRALLDRTLERKGERLEAVAARLRPALTARAARDERRLLTVTAKLSPEPLRRRLDQRAARLEAVALRLDAALPRRFEKAEDRLMGLARALASLDPKRPRHGFARVEDSEGRMVASAGALAPGQAVSLVFDDGRRGAVIDGADGAPATPRTRPKIEKAPPPEHGKLF